MKIIKVPYKNYIQSILNSLIIIVIIGGVTFMALSFYKKDWKVFMTSTLITIPTSILFWKLMTLEILIWTLDFIEIKIISNINSDGFTIEKNQKKNRIIWDEIKEVSLSTKKNLLIKFTNGKQTNISAEYSCWYLLIQNIPSTKLKDSGIPEYIDQMFKNLKTCKICGAIAVKSKKCLSCSSMKYNDELRIEFLDELEYIKSEQLELFSTDNEFEEIDYFLNEKDGFKRSSKWEPIVTEREIIEYSREYYWG